MDPNAKPEDPMEETNRQNRSPELDTADEGFEDLFLEQSLGKIAIQVPAGFLPNVMYRVYEKHYRDQLPLGRALAVALVPLLLSLGFFAWEVRDFQSGRNLTSFAEAVSQKYAIVTADFDNWLSVFSGILTASWQVITGSALFFFTKTPIPLQLLIYAALVAFIFLIRRWMSVFRKS